MACITKVLDPRIPTLLLRLLQLSVKPPAVALIDYVRFSIEAVLELRVTRVRCPDRFIS
jgi:hypothetical protein